MPCLPKGEKKDVDGRDKRGHDDGDRSRLKPADIKHVGEFAAMAPPLIFDRSLLRARRRRGLRLGPETFLLDRVAEDFADRLRVVLRRFELAADIGTPTAAVRAALASGGSVGAVIAVDPMIDAPRHLTGDHAAAAAWRVVADEEALPF